MARIETSHWKRKKYDGFLCDSIELERNCEKTASWYFDACTAAARHIQFLFHAFVRCNRDWKNAFSNLPVLFGNRFDHCFRVQIVCTLLVSFAVHFFALRFVHSQSQKSICSLSTVFRALYIVCGFCSRKLLRIFWRRKEKKMYLLFGCPLRFWLFGIIIIMEWMQVICLLFNRFFPSFFFLFHFEYDRNGTHYLWQ